MRTRTTLVVLSVALGLPVLPLTAAAAGTAELGSGFGSVSLDATARGQELLFGQGIPGQLSVPYAASSLRFGEGSATATVGWPGDTAAALGTTLVLLGAPGQATALNDPAVAYARSGGGDADVRNTTVPTATMHATATKTQATALASADGSSALSTTAGSTSSTSSVRLTGATSAVGSATSSARDVTLGVVHVRSVISTATGSTDGRKADARGSTTVSGLTVAGVPVTVDEHGVSVAGTGVVRPGAADAVTAALAQAQVTLTLTKPVKTVTRGKVEYSTGGLVVTTPMGTLTLGGAELVLSATLADAAGAVPDVPLPLPVTPAGGRVAAPPAGQPPTAAQPGPVVEPPAAAPALPGAGGLLPVVAVSLRSGYGWAWVVSGLLLSFLAASGLLGLSRRWLAPDLSGCPLEGRLP